MSGKKTTMSRKKLISIGAGVTIVAVCGGYTAISIQQWQSMQSDADRSMSELRQVKKSLLADSTTSKERYTVMHRLADAEAEHSCSVGWWGDWQAGLFTGAKGIKKACEKAQDQRIKVGQQAKKTVQFLDDQMTLQTVLAKLSLGKTAITEGDVAKHVKTTSAVSKELKEMPMHEPSRSLLAKAQGVVRTIEVAWAGVQKADKAENRKQYEAAVEALDLAYHELSTVAKQATASYASLLADLEKTLP